ncbi:MAG TPA: CopG family transcriptional regulator [Polyangiaceae bacterium]|nr:CopG family transcriptional regulator [Polyangiaceae bacterium]
MTYVTMYGMHRTTIYLPESLRADLANTAKRLKMSEATLVRQALERHLAQVAVPAPRLPLFESGKRGLAERADAALKGFGER